MSAATTKPPQSWQGWALTVVTTMLGTGLVAWMSFGRAAIVRDAQQDMRLDAADEQRAELRAQLSMTSLDVRELTRTTDRLVTKVEMVLPSSSKESR